MKQILRKKLTTAMLTFLQTIHITLLWPGYRLWGSRGGWWSYRYHAAKPMTAVWDCVSTSVSRKPLKELSGLIAPVIVSTEIQYISVSCHVCSNQSMYSNKTWSFPDPDQVCFVPEPNQIINRAFSQEKMDIIEGMSKSQLIWKNIYCMLVRPGRGIPPPWLFLRFLPSLFLPLFKLSFSTQHVKLFFIPTKGLRTEWCSLYRL